MALRAAALADKRTASAAALADAVAARDQHNLTGDIDDALTSEKLQGRVDHYNSTLAGLDGALAALKGQIGDTEARIKADTERSAREAASARLERDLSAYQKTLAAYLAAARNFTSALEPIKHWHFEVGEMCRFASNCATQIEITGAISLQELQGMVKAIAKGTMPIPPKKPIPAPVAVATEPAPETRRVFVLRSVKWITRAGGSSVRIYTDLDLPPVLAQRGLHLGALTTLNDERRSRLRDVHGAMVLTPTRSMSSTSMRSAMPQARSSSARKATLPSRRRISLSSAVALSVRPRSRFSGCCDQTVTR
jgi:hypothetical protein